jgi:hypothetical protein
VTSPAMTPRVDSIPPEYALITGRIEVVVLPAGAGARSRT